MGSYACLRLRCPFARLKVKLQPACLARLKKQCPGVVTEDEGLLEDAPEGLGRLEFVLPFQQLPQALTRSITAARPPILKTGGGPLRAVASEQIADARVLFRGLAT